jgi:NAD(P)-dependent dehydrogenase (short-subunit alcohol dehydrogenase family)
MNGKICMVTGANGAIGQAMATELSRLGATVVLACRNEERGEAARAAVMTATGNKAVELLLVDLSARASIYKAVVEFLSRHNRLDVLINNAAIVTRQRSVTTDGLEMMFATNHLGPFLMTNLLLDCLKTSAPAQVLTVTAPSTVALNFDDLQGEQHFNALRTFGASKMCNLLFTYELARRQAGIGVRVNAIHPGLVKSNLMKESPFFIRWFSRLASGSPEKSAKTAVYLAASPEAANITGKFFQDKKPIESNAYSHDQAVQRRLWDVSAALVQLA